MMVYLFEQDHEVHNDWVDFSTKIWKFAVNQQWRYQEANCSKVDGAKKKKIYMLVFTWTGGSMRVYYGWSRVTEFRRGVKNEV